MTDARAELVMDTIDCLMAVSGTAVDPEDAATRLHRVEARHPQTRLRLLWQTLGTDECFHYDALLRLPEGGTLSLGYSPAQALPWLLHGARRWSDADLLRVGDFVLTVDHAIAHLDGLSEGGTLAQRLIDACLVKEELTRCPVEVGDAELQRAMDGFRRAQRLFSAADTQRWLQRNCLTHADLERRVADHAAVALLRERLTAGRVTGYFEQHHVEFDRACIASIGFSDPAAAQQARARIQAGKLDFFEAAQSRWLEQAASGEDEPTSGLFRTLRRGRLPTPLSAAVFAATAGEWVGPIDADEGCSVVRVLRFIPASLDDGTRATIQRLLFDDWLQQQCESADIEWHRGRGRR